MITQEFKTALIFAIAAIFMNTSCVHHQSDSYSLKNTSDCKHEQNSIRCVAYQSNYDGDTFRFNMPDIHPILSNKSIRLNDIQAGEIKGVQECEKRMGRKATEFAKEILSSAKRIDLEKLNWAEYCRIGANVIVDGKDLGTLLLEKKLALPAQPKPLEADWCELEKFL